MDEAQYSLAPEACLLDSPYSAVAGLHSSSPGVEDPFVVVAAVDSFGIGILWVEPSTGSEVAGYSDSALVAVVSEEAH